MYRATDEALQRATADEEAGADDGGYDAVHLGVISLARRLIYHGHRSHTTSPLNGLQTIAL